ncbi:MAG: MBL fold metallo-hydrolase [Kiritimatiellae bacterium]|nr:MBL fold metallo-hydrolase [Kiritimatiellia bacterium]
MATDIRLSFHGAARNVTGSCYLLETPNARVVVDCGYYQERKFKYRNWEPFPVHAETVDAVLLTHAHLDHCGLLPKLIHQGFKGKIYCTPATASIAQIILMDSGKIQQEDAKYKEKRHKKTGRKSPYPYAPLYTVEDAEATLPHFAEVEYGTTFEPSKGMEVSFHDAGHILGSSMIQVDVDLGNEKRRIIFSGDVGRCSVPILNDPSTFDSADYIVIESTYGNRDHKPNVEIPGKLAKIINETRANGGNVVIPSFAVERTQELLYHLHELLIAKKIDPVTVFLDSPMAIKVTDVFNKHPELFDEETVEILKRGEHPCDFPGLVMSRTVDESKAIKKARGAIIIAGSGMCTGGRIKHHLISNIERPESTILFVGYQAMGTLGRILLEGADEVRLHGDNYKVAARVGKLNGISAHADRNELLAWLKALKNKPRKVFVTHGENDAATAFGELVQREIGCDTVVPEYGESADLT